MTKVEKLLVRMRNNPRSDWQIDDFKALAERYRIDWRQPGTSHITFTRAGLEPVVIPAHKPVKPIYVTRFLALIDKIGEHHGE